MAKLCYRTVENERLHNYGSLEKLPRQMLGQGLRESPRRVDRAKLMLSYPCRIRNVSGTRDNILARFPGCHANVCKLQIAEGFVVLYYRYNCWFVLSWQYPSATEHAIFFGIVRFVGSRGFLCLLSKIGLVDDAVTVPVGTICVGSPNSKRKRFPCGFH